MTTVMTQWTQNVHHTHLVRTRIGQTFRFNTNPSIADGHKIEMPTLPNKQPGNLYDRRAPIYMGISLKDTSKHPTFYKTFEQYVSFMP